MGYNKLNEDMKKYLVIFLFIVSASAVKAQIGDLYFNVQPYNVLNYNFKNDSSTDNSAAAKLLFGFIPDGASVFFPGGKGYIFSDSILINKNMKIYGAGLSAFTMLEAGNPPFFVDTLQKGATNLYFTSATKNGFCVHLSATGKNTILDISGLSIINTSGTTPTAGSGIVLDDNVQQCHIHDLTVRGFYNDIYVKAAMKTTINNCFIAAPIKYGVILDNTLAVDYGGVIFKENGVYSGLLTSSTAIGLIIHGGGAINISDNFFNAQLVFGKTTEFLYDVYSDFSTGLTSDIKLHHNFYENYQISAINMNNVNATRILLLSIDGEEIAPYDSLAQNAIYVHNFSQVNIWNITAFAANPTIGYACVKIDSCDHVSLNGINSVGFASNDSLVNKTTLSSPGIDGVNMFFPTSTSATGSTLLLSNSSTTNNYGILLMRPVQTNSNSIFSVTPNGTGSGEIDAWGADRTTGNAPYIALGASSTNAYINSLGIGSSAALPIKIGITNPFSMTINADSTITMQDTVFFSPITGSGATLGAYNNSTLSTSAQLQFFPRLPSKSASLSIAPSTGATGAEIDVFGNPASGSFSYLSLGTTSSLVNIASLTSGGTVRPIHIYTGSNTNQSVFFTSGNTGFATATDNAAIVQVGASTTTNASMFFNGAAVDVTSPTNGMLWYNSTAHTLNFRDNGVTTNLLAATTPTLSAVLAAGNTASTSNMTVQDITNRHNIGSGTAPTTNNLGTNVTSATLTGTDDNFQVVVVTSAAVSGTIFKVTFNTTWGSTPHTVFSPQDAVTGAGATGLWGGSTNATTINFGGAIPIAGTYTFNFITRQ